MADPYANPYLMPQPAPDWRQVLSNALIGVGGGISSADASGRGWAAGIGPGLMYANQMTGQQNQNAWQRQMQGLQYQSLLDQRRAQEEARREKLDMAKAAAAREAALGDSIGTLLGMNVQPNPVRMGPDFSAPSPDRDAFVQTMMPHALEVSRQTGLDPRLVIAQSALETGWGKSAPGNNYFGVKSHGRPGGQMLATTEAGPGGMVSTQDSFRTYADPGASAQDYAEFIKGNAGRYLPVRLAQGLDAQIDAMGKSGYATDPQYGAKLRQIARSIGGPQAAQAGGRVVAQGDAIAGQGDAPVTPQNAIASLPAEVRAGIALMAKTDPKKALEMTVQAIQNQEKEGAWVPLDARNKAMFPNLDPTKEYLRNRRTGEIKPIGGSQTVVNVDKGEPEFTKEMGKMDAQRFGKIIEAEGLMNDMASKLGYAMDQFRQTYTGPGAETANYLNKILGAAGFEEAGKKGSAADAAMAVVSQLKPTMRAAGSGASSDRDMDMFGRALPNLINLPDGNERIVSYFQRMADRATRIRELAQEHSEGGKVPLTRTGFDKAVKDLGPLFSDEERTELQELGKKKPESSASAAPAPTPAAVAMPAGASPAPSTPVATIPRAAIKHLMMNPKLVDEFELKYGPGTADAVLRGAK